MRADKVYLATVQDRFTRIAGAIPAFGMKFPTEPGEFPGLGSQTWASAVLLAQSYLCDRPLYAVYADNGLGIAPAFNTLSLAARVVLSTGARLIFIPPAQPWRNGRLERFHYTMEREYWREERPTSIPQALSGLTDFLNYHNADRPHSSIKGYDVPASRLPNYQPLPEAYWTLINPPAKFTAQAGIIEAIRMVYNDGQVDTWGHMLHLSPALAGQYVRIRFDITGEISTGQVIYQQRKNEDIVVAHFRHTLDAKGHGGPQAQLYHDVELFEFADDVPANQLLDEDQLANQHSRVLKRRSSLERKLAGEAPPTDSIGD